MVGSIHVAFNHSSLKAKLFSLIQGENEVLGLESAGKVLVITKKCQETDNGLTSIQTPELYNLL